MVLTAGPLDPQSLITNFGSWGFTVAVLIIFTECGILLGLVLPGDSLLFVAGMLIASGLLQVHFALAWIAFAGAAIMGNLVGYWVGARVGPPLFRRPDSRLFKQEYVQQTSGFFDRHGAKAIVLARFVPIVRTIITAMAGIGGMNFNRYATFSVLGGLLWVSSMLTAGYFLGTVPLVADNIEAVTIGIVLLSVLPIAFEWLKARRTN